MTGTFSSISEKDNKYLSANVASFIHSYHFATGLKPTETLPVVGISGAFTNETYFSKTIDAELPHTPRYWQS